MPSYTIFRQPYVIFTSKNFKEKSNELFTAHPVFLPAGETNLLFGMLKLKRVWGIRKFLFAFENKTNSG